MKTESRFINTGRPRGRPKAAENWPPAAIQAVTVAALDAHGITGAKAPTTWTLRSATSLLALHGIGTEEIARRFALTARRVRDYVSAWRRQEGVNLSTFRATIVDNMRARGEGPPRFQREKPPRNPDAAARPKEPRPARVSSGAPVAPPGSALGFGGVASKAPPKPYDPDPVIEELIRRHDEWWWPHLQAELREQGREVTLQQIKSLQDWEQHVIADAAHDRSMRRARQGIPPEIPPLMLELAAKLQG